MTKEKTHKKDRKKKIEKLKIDEECLEHDQEL